MKESERNSERKGSLLGEIESQCQTMVFGQTKHDTPQRSIWLGNPRLDYRRWCITSTHIPGHTLIFELSAYTLHELKFTNPLKLIDRFAMEGCKMQFLMQQHWPTMTMFFSTIAENQNSPTESWDPLKQNDDFSYWKFNMAWRELHIPF